MTDEQDPLDDGDGGQEHDEPAGPAARMVLPVRCRVADATEEARAHEAEAQDDHAHLARGETDGGHALAAAIAQRLGAGPGVADHERRAHGRRGEPGADVEAGPGAADDDAQVDDRLAPAVEGAVHERAELAGRAGDARHGAIEHVEGGAGGGHDARQQPPLDGRHQGTRGRRCRSR